MPARVVITEGERAADALEAAGVHAIATVCGAGSVPGPSFADILAGVRVTLWPDADGPGRDHMGRVARLLEPVVATMAVVDLPADAPSGWDAADASPAQVRRLVATAHNLWLAR
jgi:putative DNA primase/helicase